MRGVTRWTMVVVAAAGSFKCEGTPGHGFLRISKRNPFRYEYEDGTPFYPIGIQTTHDDYQRLFDVLELPDAVRRKVMGGNAAMLLGL